MDPNIFRSLKLSEHTIELLTHDLSRNNTSVCSISTDNLVAKLACIMLEKLRHKLNRFEAVRIKSMNQITTIRPVRHVNRETCGSGICENATLDLRSCNIKILDYIGEVLYYVSTFVYCNPTEQEFYDSCLYIAFDFLKKFEYVGTADREVVEEIAGRVRIRQLNMWIGDHGEIEPYPDRGIEILEDFTHKWLKFVLENEAPVAVAVAVPAVGVVSGAQ